MSIALFLAFLILAGIIWLLFKFAGLTLKLAYVFFIGIPLALVVGSFGVVLCCTLILLPAGLGLIRLAGKLIYPL